MIGMSSLLLAALALFSVDLLQFTNDQPSKADGNPRQDCHPTLLPTQLNYKSVLLDGLAPSQINFAGRPWRVNAASSWSPSQPHSVQISASGEKVRFELRDTPQDRSINDPIAKRRAELSGSLYGKRAFLPNKTELWGAFSFVHHPWPDPDAMSQTWGGVYGQIHMGRGFGGSPALAFRRNNIGELVVTTRGELDAKGTERFKGDVTFGEPHDIVYRLVLDEERGELDVWLNGARIASARDVAIGSSYADSYWAFGLYFSSGIAEPISAEYAHVVYPSPQSLKRRISSVSGWPGCRPQL